MNQQIINYQVNGGFRANANEPVALTPGPLKKIPITSDYDISDEDVNALRKVYEEQTKDSVL